MKTNTDAWDNALGYLAPLAAQLAALPVETELTVRTHSGAEHYGMIIETEHPALLVLAVMYEGSERHANRTIVIALDRVESYVVHLTGGV